MLIVLWGLYEVYFINYLTIYGDLSRKDNLT
jgi:hypothetical protein